MTRGEIKVHELVLSNLCGSWLRTPWGVVPKDIEAPIWAKPHCTSSKSDRSSACLIAIIVRLFIPLPQYSFLFFFEQRPPGGTTPMETARVSSISFFFWGMGGVRVVKPNHRRRPPNVPFSCQPKLSVQRSQWACSGNRWTTTRSLWDNCIGWDRVSYKRRDGLLCLSLSERRWNRKMRKARTRLLCLSPRSPYFFFQATARHLFFSSFSCEFLQESFPRLQHCYGLSFHVFHRSVNVHST